MDAALRLQKERERIHRWRASKRQAGNDMLTIWLPRELKLYIEDMALKRHCSPSDLIQQALTTCYPQSADVTGTVTGTTVTDTSQIRLMLQQELRAFLGDIHLSQGIAPAQRVTDTITDTPVQAEAVRAATEIPYVTDTVTDTATDTVTDTHAEPVPEGATDHQGEHVTDTVTDTLAPHLPVPYVIDTDTDHDTDTVTDTETVTDTVAVTGQALEPFDTAKYVLGKLCPRGHAWGSTGQSLLRRTNRHCCACDREKFQERGKVQRQARRQQQRQQEVQE